MSSKHGRGHRARWTDEHGIRQSASFHLKRDAERYELRKKAEVEEIKLGLRVGAPAKHTCGELFDLWKEKRAPRKRSRKDDVSIIERHLRPFFGRMKVGEVGTEDVDDYVNEKLEELSEKYVANHLTLLTTILRWAADFRVPWLVVVPKFKKPRVVVCGTDYQYLRNNDEIGRFLRAAKAEGPVVLALYATAVYTGMRAGELAGLEWSDVDFENRLITAQRSFTGPTKSNRVRHVPILDALLPVLRAWRLACPSPRIVFPSRAGTMQHPSARIFQEVLHRVLRAANLPDVERRGKKRPYIRFHDLRHTFASTWMINGGNIYRLQRILGHQSIVMTERYSHLAPTAFQEDYGRFATAVLDGAVVSPLARIGGKADEPATATEGPLVTVSSGR